MSNRQLIRTIRGRLGSIGNAAVTYTYGYDDLDRRTSQRDSRTGKTIEWSYDKVGNVTSRKGYEGDVTTFTYDSANRLVGMTNPDYLGATYHYDGAGRLLDRIFSNGQRTEYGYDADSRLTSLKQYAVDGSISKAEKYCYDEVGNLTYVLPTTATCDSPGATWTQYKYDGVYRLTDEIVSTSGTQQTLSWYKYDAAGNITFAFGDGDVTPSGNYYAYDKANRLQNIQTTIPSGGGPVPTGVKLFQFDYDNEGNRTAKRDGSGVALETYDYDAKNQMIAFHKSGLTTTYAYDPFGYRIGVQAPTGERSMYALDGQHIEAMYNGAGLPQVSYLRGAVIDEVIGAYSYGTDGQRTFYSFEHDRLTSVRSLADHTGAMVQTYSYGPFGADRGGTGSTSNLLRYTGREKDPTGFYYYRSRYYDPGVRRFVTEDPAGFDAGINLYTYANNNPVTANDPTGRDTFQIGLAVSGTIPVIGLTLPAGSGIAFDTHGNIGLYNFAGAGGGIGGGVGGGVSFAYSDADTIFGLQKGFWNTNLNVGAGARGSVDIFTGTDLDNSPITGAGITLGAGVEASETVTWTYTVVTPLEWPRSTPQVERIPTLMAANHELPVIRGPYDKPWR